MKVPLILPPALAVAAVAVWIGFQRHSIAEVERETAVLRQGIAAAREVADSSGRPTAGAEARDRRAGSEEPIDWKSFAGRIEEMESGRDMGTMMRVQQRLLDLSGEELAAALDEVRTLDISPQARRTLEDMLLGIYVQKDPEVALKRFIGRIGENDEGGMAWRLSRGLAEWARRDPAAAVAWFDRQIAAGAFESKSLDGRSQSRSHFEAALLPDLLNSDPAAAERRMLDLPADQRGDVLQQILIQEVDPGRFATLVRSISKDDAATAILSTAASRLVQQGGYEGVEKFLEEVGASPAERAAAVEQAAVSRIRQVARQGGVSRDEIESMRQLAERQAPGTADTLTGDVLASISRGRSVSYPESAALALEYHQTSGSDEVLAAFLENTARSDRGEARPLLEYISDPELRARLAEQLR